MDPTGYIQKIIQAMPLPNAYDGPSLLLYQGSCASCPTATLTPNPNATTIDGLNTAVHRWVRRTIGQDAGGTGQIIDAYNRNQINVKIDHNINSKNRLSGSGLYGGNAGISWKPPDMYRPIASG